MFRPFSSSSSLREKGGTAGHAAADDSIADELAYALASDIVDRKTKNWKPAAKSWSTSYY
jgi:hypothetical protein